MELLTERHADKIAGILTCYDRVVITGTMPQICYAAGITSWLYAHAIRIFDYPNWADQLRLKIRENAERIAKENGIEIKHLKKSSIRKEDHVQRILKSRGYEPGLVHILLFFRSEKKSAHSYTLQSAGGEPVFFDFLFAASGHNHRHTQRQDAQESLFPMVCNDLCHTPHHAT